jgi:hypothetical protein
MTDEAFQKRKDEDRRLLRALEAQNLRTAIAETPPEELEKYTVVVGDRSFTLQQMLNEVEEGTEYGELYVATMVKSRTERLRRK